MYGGDCDVAIAEAAAAVTHVQSQSQEVGSGDEGLGLLCFDLSSQIRRRRRAARSLTSQGRAEPLCAKIESANREVSEGKADL